MSEAKYYSLLNETLEATLLHLYCKIADVDRHVPATTRNKIIIDFIKPKLKQQRYSLIKKKLKTIVLMKDKFGSIELKLIDIVESYNNSIAETTDVTKLYDLFEKFEKKGIDTKLTEEVSEFEDDTIYIDRSHIDSGFDDDNNQINPITLLVKTNDTEPFKAVLDDYCLFDYSISEDIEGSLRIELKAKGKSF